MTPAPRRALALLASTQFLLILDTALINVAAPSIGHDLGLPPTTLSWVANAYLVTFGGLLLLSGRAADLRDRRRLFVLGLGVLVLASVAGAVAGDAVWLIAARAVQGIGAAVAAAAAFAMLLELFPAGRKRHRALGVFAAMAGAGGAAGTVLGGVLTSSLGWRSTFWLNVAAGVVLALLAFRVLAGGRRRRERTGVDVAGALSATAGLGLLAYALVNTGVDGWTAPGTLVPAGLGAALLLGFVAVERAAAAPLVPAEVVRRPVLAVANVLAALGQAVLFPMFFLLSVHLQAVRSYPPVLGGIALLPLCVVVMAVAAGAGRIIGAVGLKRAMVGGFALVAGGLAALSRLTADGAFVPEILLPTLVIGAGLPLVAITTGAVATSQAGPSEVGLASGLINTSQQFGAVLGLAVLSGVAAARTATAGRPADGAALTAGFATAFLVAAGIAALVALSAAFALRVPDNRSAPLERDGHHA